MCIAVHGYPSQSYIVSKTMQCYLPPKHGWINHVITPAKQNDNQFTNPRGMVRLTWLSWLAVYQVGLSVVCRSVFFNLFAAVREWKSLMESHALIHDSSDVRKAEAIECLHTYFPNRAELSWARHSSKKWLFVIWNLTALVEQYVIVFNQTQRARRSSSLSQKHQQWSEDCFFFYY